MVACVWLTACTTNTRPNNDHIQVNVQDSTTKDLSDQRPLVDNLKQVNKKPEELPARWVRLTQNASGLAVHYINKGVAQELSIKNDTIINSGHNASPVTWIIRKTKKTGKHTWLFDLGNADCTLEVIDTNTWYARQTVTIFDTKARKKKTGQYSGLYVPIANKDKFPRLDETDIRHTQKTSHRK